MRDEAVMSIVSISLMGGAAICWMVLWTVKSIVRTSMLTSLKAKCIASGMSADEIERVVLVGEGKCAIGRVQKSKDDFGYPVEKAPPVVANRSYVSAH
jgi:hypothetical protein